MSFRKGVVAAVVSLLCVSVVQAKPKGTITLAQGFPSVVGHEVTVKGGFSVDTGNGWAFDRIQVHLINQNTGVAHIATAAVNSNNGFVSGTYSTEHSLPNGTYTLHVVLDVMAGPVLGRVRAIDPNPVVVKGK